MQDYGPCKCGHFQWFGTIPPEPCARCRKCGTGPHGREPEPHDFSSVTKVDTDAGEAVLTRCRYCHATRKQVEKREAA